MTRTLDLAVVAGDGIGPEVTAEALKVLRATGTEVRTTEYPFSAAHYLETIDAPVKQTVWFESSAHNVPFEEPERFMAMVAKVLDDAHITSPARESGRPFPSP